MRLPLVLALLAPCAAQAACPAANLYSFFYSSQAATTLAYGSTYTYTASTPGGATQNFTAGFTQNGLSSVTVGGENRPNISNSHNGGGAGTALVVGGVLSSRTADITSGTRVMVTTFTFPTPVRDVAFAVHDVDFGANQFRDWLQITGFNGAASYTPSMTTPWGTDNSGGAVTNANSSINLGPDAAPFTIAANQAIGVGVSGNNSTTGTINVSFAQPVTSVQLRYGNYPLTAGETVTGQQAFAIEGVSWCPMPSLTVSKTGAPWSDPVNATTNPKLIPGGDLIYSLTVANANTSPVDLSTTVLTDAIPATLTFYNGDIDDAGPLTANFEFVPGASGLGFVAANLSYSNNGGATYVYAPGAGYDANVTALRFAPTGNLAANSSFTLRFRVRVK